MKRFLIPCFTILILLIGYQVIYGVRATVTLSGSCPLDAPITVEFSNWSLMRVVRVDFTPVVWVDGVSRNVLSYQGHYTSRRIIEPFTTGRACLDDDYFPKREMFGASHSAEVTTDDLKGDMAHVNAMWDIRQRAEIRLEYSVETELPF